MRIDAYNQVQQIYGAKQTPKVDKGYKAGGQDQLQISSRGKDFQTVKQTLENIPDVREEVVAPLKTLVKSGEYKVGVDAFANHLFEKYNEANLGTF